MGRPRTWRASALGVALGVGLLASAGVAQPESSEGDTPQTGEPADAPTDEPAGEPDGPPPPPPGAMDLDNPCRTEDACVEAGRCTAEDDRCFASGDADCRGSKGCRESGRCSAKGGVCVASSNTDCADSTRCNELGLCTRVGDRCMASGDDDCRRSLVCRDDELCRAKSGVCVGAEVLAAGEPGNTPLQTTGIVFGVFGLITAVAGGVTMGYALDEDDDVPPEEQSLSDDDRAVILGVGGVMLAGGVLVTCLGFAFYVAGSPDDPAPAARVRLSPFGAELHGTF